MATVTELLPAELAARLDEAALRKINEAPRDERLAALAQALGQPPKETLEELAAATGLPVVTELKIDDESRPLLPARLAAEFQLVPLKIAEAKAGELHLATSWLPDDVATDWVHTFTPREIHWHLAAAEKVQQLIRDNYGVGGGESGYGR